MSKLNGRRIFGLFCVVLGVFIFIFSPVMFQVNIYPLLPEVCLTPNGTLTFSMAWACIAGWVACVEACIFGAVWGFDEK